MCEYTLCFHMKAHLVFIGIYIIRCFLQYCWFSHDVTKIQTTKLSILLRRYFHYVLEQLRTSFHTNFCFKRVLGFVIEYVWISKLLCDVAFTWRPGELSFQKVTSFGEFCDLNSSWIRESINLMFMSSLRNKFTLLYQNSVTDVLLVSIRHVGAHPG